MVLNMEKKKILKCKLTIEWTEEDVEDYIQYLTGDDGGNLSLEEARRRAEEYAMERTDNIMWAADNNLCNYEDKFEVKWVEE